MILDKLQFIIPIKDIKSPYAGYINTEVKRITSIQISDWLRRDINFKYKDYIFSNNIIYKYENMMGKLSVVGFIGKINKNYFKTKYTEFTKEINSEKHYLIINTSDFDITLKYFTNSIAVDKNTFQSFINSPIVYENLNKSFIEDSIKASVNNILMENNIQNTNNVSLTSVIEEVVVPITNEDITIF